MFIHNSIYISSGVVISLILCINGANGITNEPHYRCAEYNYECDPLFSQPCCNSSLSCKIKKSRREFICGEKGEIGASCVTDEDCFEIAHAKCSTEKKCVCRTNNLSLNGTYCAPILGGFCWNNESCATKNALCVDNKCRCRENYSERGDQCLPIFGRMRCNYDRDCAKIRFAKCSENNYCVCSLNTVINTSLCGLVLNSYCTMDKDCPVENSICTNNKCQCRPEYVAINDNQCMHSNSRISCTNDDFCKVFMNNARCSEHKICNSNNNSDQVNQEAYIEAYLGMSCTNDLFCNFYINHTICSPEKKCVCGKNSYYYNRTVHSLLFNMSPNNEECKVEQAFCLQNKCYHHSVAGFSEKSCSEDNNCFGSLLGELCNVTRDCIPYNSVCSDRKCKCAINYRNDSILSCLPSMLNQSFYINSHRSLILNAECSDHQCECKAGYVKSSAMTCSPLLGTQCMKHEECAVSHSICFDGKCECSDYFIPQSNDRCRSTILHMTCETDRDCENIKFSHCSSYNSCSCTNNSIALYGSMCGVLLNQDCSHDLPCVTENSVCVENKCECKPSYKNSNAECSPIGLGDSCDSSRDCNMIKYAECSTSKTCSCLTNYVPVNGTLCKAHLNEHCQVDDECYVGNSDCIANKCQCRDGFLADDINSRCESRTLGTRCNTSEECSSIKNSICSSDKICICPSKHFALESNFCIPTINTICSNDIQCADDSFRCEDGKCQCISGYTAISVDKCIETHLLYSCTDTSECSDSWHWNCATNGKCVCNVDNIAINNSTCLPSLNGYCWRDDQCMAENSVCTDFRCQCKTSSVAVANNHCAIVSN